MYPYQKSYYEKKSVRISNLLCLFNQNESKFILNYKMNSMYLKSDCLGDIVHDPFCLSQC